MWVWLRVVTVLSCVWLGASWVQTWVLLGRWVTVLRQVLVRLMGSISLVRTV